MLAEVCEVRRRVWRGGGVRGRGVPYGIVPDGAPVGEEGRGGQGTPGEGLEKGAEGAAGAHGSGGGGGRAGSGEAEGAIAAAGWEDSLAGR